MPYSLLRASYWRQAEEAGALADHQFMHETQLFELIELRYFSDKHHFILF